MSTKRSNSNRLHYPRDVRPFRLADRKPRPRKISLGQRKPRPVSLAKVTLLQQSD